MVNGYHQQYFCLEENLLIFILFYIPLENLSLTAADKRLHTFGLFLVLWAIEKGRSRATPVGTRCHGFGGLFEGSSHFVDTFDKERMLRTYSNPDTHGMDWEGMLNPRRHLILPPGVLVSPFISLICNSY
jgi:hypothetical protein